MERAVSVGADRIEYVRRFTNANDSATARIVIRILDADVSVRAAPAHIEMTRGQASTGRITYTFTGGEGLDAVLESPQGVFTAAGRQIGSLSKPLTARIQGGRGVVSESLRVPAEVMEQAVSAGADRIEYVRTFENTDYSLSARTVIAISQPPMNLNARPDRAKIARGVSSTQRIDFILSTASNLDTVLESRQGVFTANGRQIGRVDTALEIQIRNGKGRTSESLNVPVAISRRAEQADTNRVQYVRTFSSQFLSASVQVEFLITTEAGAEFRITRIELYFKNQRPEITIKRNQAPPKLYAEIQYVGSGLLRGYWEVDGRLLSRIDRHLVYSSQAVIELPDAPPLPTFQPGAHIVSLVVEDPGENITPPQAVYYVEARSTKKITEIQLNEPADKAEVPFGPILFSWESRAGLETYHVVFQKQDQVKPSFSAYTRESSYRLPESVVKRHFDANDSYSWQVQGYDKDRQLAGHSKTRAFGFSGAKPAVSGQILVLLDGTVARPRIRRHLGLPSSVDILETFPLSSIDARAVILSTDEGSESRLMEKLRKNPSVILVQPNYIFTTWSDPLVPRQKLFRLMGMDCIHSRATGRDISCAVIDTGADATHEDLAGRIKVLKNCLGEGAPPAEIHGTAVAGLIAGDRNDVGMVGMAPEVDVLALRACRQEAEDASAGKCYSASIAKALDIAVASRAAVVNMSFGTPANDPLLSRLIAAGAEAGLLFVAPVGGRTGQLQPSYPASHEQVIAVGGIGEAGKPLPNPRLAERADVLAPATELLTCVPNNDYNVLSGTSFASAIVSGLLALAEEFGTLNGGMESIPASSKDWCQWIEALLGENCCSQKEN
jgi:subtilisin family serine protease